MISASMEGKPDKFMKAALKALPMVRNTKSLAYLSGLVLEGFRTWDGSKGR